MNTHDKQEERTLGKAIGEIASVAIVNMISDNRWYQNWSSRDNEANWTKDNFHLLKYPEDLGTLGGAAIDFVIEVKPKIQELINSEVNTVLERLKEEAIEIAEYQSPDHYKCVEVIPLSAITALQQEYKEK